MAAELEEAHAALERALAHDRSGREREAIPHYRSALAAGGLTVEEEQEALLGLGSSLRVLGEYEPACEVLVAAHERFPEYRAFEPFLAMTLLNLGRHDEATELLLRCLAETSADPSVSRYRRALLAYAPRLDETWG